MVSLNGLKKNYAHNKIYNILRHSSMRLKLVAKNTAFVELHGYMFTLRSVADPEGLQNDRRRAV